jgi:hypothetical protein
MDLHFWSRHRMADHETLSEAASSDPYARWINGVILLPPVPLLLGIWCLVRGAAVIPGRGRWMTVGGQSAAAIGIALIAAGLFAHFHWFWSGHPRWPVVGQVGKVITLLVFAASLLFVFYKNLLT